jgi:dihydroorotase/N-acyl-D-amino-acid deacylase
VVVGGGLVLRAQTSPPFDLVITGGRIVDGTGAPWFEGDVAVREGRIEAIGHLSSANVNAARKIDAAGLVVAPGFIDMLGQSEFSILVDGRAASKIMQGVTTEVTGEGSSIAPLNDRMIADRSASYRHFGVEQDFRTLGEYCHRVETRSRAAVNVASFVGAGGVRDYVIGRENRPATASSSKR